MPICLATPLRPGLRLCRVALAAVARAIALVALPALAHADCIDDAATRHQVNPLILRAIGWQESRLQPAALGRNANGSVDLGAFQINSVHLAELARYGVDRSALRDGCVSADVAAWHYRRQIELQGDSWLAVGAYHSHTAARAAWYANQIATILERWNVMPAGALPFPPEHTLAPSRPIAPVPRSPAARSVVDIDAAHSDRRTFSAIAFLPPAR